MQSRPLISVVTVCKDAAQFIADCVDSVLAALPTADAEYVVIDGGSSDGTAEILEKYREHFAYWHSKPDSGIADAFNQAIARTRGEWILFLNADDMLAGSEVLAEMAAILELHRDADVVFGQIMIATRTPSPVTILSGPHGQPFRWTRMMRTNVIPHQAAFTARSLFDELGPFSEEFTHAMDYEFYLRKGRRLRADFAPVLVAYQRAGGRSLAGFSRTLEECERAQVEIGGRNSVAARLDRLYFIIRHRVAAAVRLVAGTKVC